MAIGTPSGLKALAPLAGTIVVGFRGVKWQASNLTLAKLGGSSGIDGQSFAGTEPKGVEAWLDQLAKELKDLPAAIGTEGSNS